MNGEQQPFYWTSFFPKYTILVKVTPTVTPSSNRVDSRQAWFFRVANPFVDHK